MAQIKKLKIIYMGTPPFSAKLLESLITDGFNIVGVVTQEDALVGRKRVLTPSPVKEVALTHNIPVFTPRKIKEEHDFIIQLQPDLILTFAYGQIVPLAVLKAPKYGALNLHGSLLPKYRGASPIQRALMNNDAETGVTLMEMIMVMDAGRMYAKSKFTLTNEDNFITVANKMAEVSLPLLVEALPHIISGKNVGIKQDEKAVTYAPLLTRSDEFIDFESDTVVNVLGKVRAFTPEPGVSVRYDNNVLKIYEAEHLNNKIEFAIGTLFVSAKILCLQLKDGQIALISLQKSGKTRINSSAFINGEQTKLPFVLQGFSAND